MYAGAHQAVSLRLLLKEIESTKTTLSLDKLRREGSAMLKRQKRSTIRSLQALVGLS